MYNCVWGEKKHFLEQVKDKLTKEEVSSNERNFKIQLDILFLSFEKK